jgi:hypothetical protein
MRVGRPPSLPASQDKLQILEQIRGTGITHIICGTYAPMRTVDDQLGELLASQPALAAGLHLHAFSQASPRPPGGDD